MPDLYGLTDHQARERLTESGFVGKLHFEKTLGEECDRKREKPGTVCGQSPTPGEQQEAGLDVWVFFQEGEPVTMLKLARIRQVSEQKARKRLAERGFTGTITTKTIPFAECIWQSSGMKENDVCAVTLGDVSLDEVRRSPSTFLGLRKEYPSDIKITLYLWGFLSLDDPIGPFPKVVGMSLEEAGRILGEHRFSFRRVRFMEQKGCASGQVCSTQPEAGWMALRGDNDSVVLTVGTRYPGRKSAPRMPDLTGNSVLQALKTVDAARLRGTIMIEPEGRYRCSSDQGDLQPGMVCRHRPEPGKKLGGGLYRAPIVLTIKRAK
jgi:beta-lactam-binding protein with PASTA domain